MKYPVDAALLKKFAQNKCTPEELVRIREFIQQPEYKEILSKMLDEEWEQFNPPTQPLEADLQDWKRAFESRRNVPAMEPAPVRPARLRILRWVGYAAACLLACMFMLYQGRKRNGETEVPVIMQEAVTALGQRARVTLPDSTMVTLGPGSRLQYPKAFALKTREIQLEGEAFFEVTHHPDRPFIIHAGNIQTRVLGTSFKIDAVKGSLVVVSVSTGKVQVSRLQQGRAQILATLAPGQKAGYDTVSKQLELQTFPVSDITGWKNGLLFFNGASLNDALNSLERWYDIDISSVPAHTGEKRVKLVVNGKKPIREAMETIRQLTGIKYAIKGRRIQIY